TPRESRWRYAWGALTARSSRVTSSSPPRPIRANGRRTLTIRSDVASPPAATRSIRSPSAQRVPLLASSRSRIAGRPPPRRGAARSFASGSGGRVAVTSRGVDHRVPLGALGAVELVAGEAGLGGEVAVLARVVGLALLL